MVTPEFFNTRALTAERGALSRCAPIAHRVCLPVRRWPGWARHAGAAKRSFMTSVIGTSSRANFSCAATQNRHTYYSRGRRCSVPISNESTNCVRFPGATIRHAQPSDGASPLVAPDQLLRGDRWPLVKLGGEPAAVGVRDRLRPVAAIGFGENVVYVGLDCGLAHIELPTDLGVR